MPRVAWRRPALILYAQDGKTKRALVRWPTTIGGWADVRIDGTLTKRWKESDVGPREWRQLYAAPTWLPPDTTPDDELVRWVAKGKWELKKSIMGPGPQSAFGMIRLPHERAIKMKNGSTQYVDNGIGTHGSAVVTSLLNGTSHGCHRLYNHLAVRLGGFLLDHRDHVVRGQQPEHFRRTINVGGTFHAQVDTRGFMYELTPPVHVDVLPGKIRSERKVPPAAAAPAGADCRLVGAPHPAREVAVARRDPFVTEQLEARRHRPAEPVQRDDAAFRAKLAQPALGLGDRDAERIVRRRRKQRQLERVEEVQRVELAPGDRERIAEHERRAIGDAEAARELLGGGHEHRLLFDAEPVRLRATAHRSSTACRFRRRYRARATRARARATSPRASRR